MDAAVDGIKENATDVRWISVTALSILLNPCLRFPVSYSAEGSSFKRTLFTGSVLMVNDFVQAHCLIVVSLFGDFCSPCEARDRGPMMML